LWAWAAFATLLALVVGFLFFRQAPPVERSLRYTIAAPENGAVHSFAISPDGRHLAIAASANGRQQLWLRALDALQAQPMPGTDEAMYPFWSPDNRYIGFFAQGKLKKVAASGGPAQSLCNAPAGLGGAWNSEDVIVFSPDANGVALQRVSAAGGVPADVTKTKGSYRFPRFLPGGRRFLYSVAIDTADKDGVFVGSLDGNENRRILADVTSAQFAPSASGGRVGHILFVRDNTLMALPFDAASAQTSGDAFPVAEGISTANRYWAPVTVSEDGVMLYAIRGGAGGSNQIVWFDRAGKLLGPVGDPGVVLMPSISPDEKMIAYTRLGAGGVADIWLRKGDRIVYTSVRSGPPNLFRRAVNGSGPDEPLLPGTTANSEQWSRDGRFIVYRGTDPQTKQDIWVLPVDDHAQPEGKPMAFLHSDFNELQGQLSPDSRWMAYTSDESGQREVYVRPFSAAQGLWRISTAGGDQPRWRGDTRELFFAGADGKMMAVAVNAAPSSNGSAKRSIESGPPVPLFESHIVTASNNSSQYDVTADGKRFLVVTNNAATGALPPLTVWVNWLAGLKR
jgi:Tol biopolymer transport system component